MRVRGHEPHSGKAAGDQIGEERVPRRAGLAGRGLQAQDFAPPVGVHAGGDHDDRADHAAALAHLHRQRVGGHEGERAGLREAAVAELLDVLVEPGSHPRYL
jgi:hypothetical protein